MSPEPEAGLAATGPNAEQIEYWNRLRGERWVQVAPLIDAQVSHIGLAAMDRLDVSPGARVLDVGCGCGQTTLQLAERVGANGAVMGIDISTVMLDAAQRSAAEAGTSQVRFENADAQTHRFAASSFDRLFSRFGVMFFADPRAAFENLRGGLAAGGRLAFACWQSLARNPWMRVPTEAVFALVKPPDPPDPHAPGPFSLADPDRVRAILSGAGFEQVALEPYECEVRVGGGADLEVAVAFALQMGPAAALLRDAEPSLREAAIDAVREALRPHVTERGVELGAATWLVTAVAPERTG